MPIPTSWTKRTDHYFEMRNAQCNYTDALAKSHHDEMEGNAALGIVGVDEAQRQYAFNLALTAQGRDVDEANARYDEITSLLLPTKTYLDDIAQLEHDYNIQMAALTAQRAASIAAGVQSDLAQAQYEADADLATAYYQAARGTED